MSIAGVFGLWNLWTNIPSGLLCFLLTLVGLFEVSVHFIGWGDADATRALRRGTKLAKGTFLGRKHRTS